VSAQAGLEIQDGLLDWLGPVRVITTNVAASGDGA
jgi:hypothetical protein